MKKIINTIMILSLVVMSSCQKSDNATMPDGIVYLNQPQIVKVSGDPAILDTDPMAFNAKISVDLYFKDSNKPDYLDLVVVKNGDTKNAKVIRGNINSYPIEEEVSGSQLSQLFGEIVSGDNFDFGANYIVDGKTYAAFPDGGGTSYGAGVASQPGASPTVRYSAICGFIADDFLGDGKFKVVTDGWADYGVDAEVMVTKIDESTISIASSLPVFGETKVKINLGDNVATVAKQALGDPGAAYYEGANYGVLSVTSQGGGTANFVNPCNGIIRVNLGYTVAAGSFGAAVLELKKI